MTITIKDESISGKISNEFKMEIEHTTVTLQEVIRLRIYKEVEEHNRKTPDYFNGLVQPTHAEKVLNGFKLREKRQIDPEKQYYLALDAFQKNGFFVLIDNTQLTELDDTLTLNVHSNISFIKLTPLVGG